MQAVQTLPEQYQQASSIDITKNHRLMVVLNVLGVVLLGLGGYLFLRAMFWLRPKYGEQALRQVQVNSLAEWLVLAGIVLGLIALHILLHEAVHGIFFWLFTRSRPRFAFHWTYAYAAAPEWYIPRNPFFVTTLAPLVFITLAGLLLIAYAPPGWILPSWFVITMNASGAIGDMLVAVWLLRYPATSLIQDRGDAVTLYRRGNVSR